MMEYSVGDSRMLVMKSVAACGSPMMEVSNSFGLRSVPLTGARPFRRDPAVAVARFVIDRLLRGPIGMLSLQRRCTTALHRCFSATGSGGLAIFACDAVECPAGD